MKSKVEITNDENGNKKIIINLMAFDVITAKPSRMELEMRRVYEATGKISDLVMYLSEVFENIKSSSKTK